MDVAMKSERVADLRLSNLGAEDVRMIAQELKVNSSVMELNLFNNPIGCGPIAGLADSLLVNKTLVRLGLNSCGVGDEGAQALARALHASTSLAWVDLGDNRIGGAGAVALAEALCANSVLTRLDLGNVFGGKNQIGDAGAQAFAEALRSSCALRTLKIENNVVGAGGAEALAASLRVNITLTTLDLANNHVGAAGALALAGALKVNRTLTSLNLFSNEILDAGALALAGALGVNSTLAGLLLGRNQIKASGAQAIADALRGNTALERLDFYRNPLGNWGAQSLADSLRKNSSLSELRLQHTHIGDAGAKALAIALGVNASVTILDVANNLIENADIAHEVAALVGGNITLLNTHFPRETMGPQALQALVDSTFQTIPAPRPPVAKLHHAAIHTVLELVKRGVVAALPVALHMASTLPQDHPALAPLVSCVQPLRAAIETMGTARARELRLVGAGLVAVDAAFLAEELRANTYLTILRLDSNLIADGGSLALAGVLRVNTTLTLLDIWDNHIGLAGIRAIADSLKSNGTLTSLSVSKNKVGSSGASALADALATNTALLYLHLSRGEIGDDGATALANVLGLNCTLTLLNLKENGLGDRGGKALADALDTNSSLVKLDVADNQVSAALLERIASAALTNQTLTAQFHHDTLTPEALVELVAAKFEGISAPRPGDSKLHHAAIRAASVMLRREPLEALAAAQDVIATIPQGHPALPPLQAQVEGVLKRFAPDWSRSRQQMRNALEDPRHPPVELAYGYLSEACLGFYKEDRLLGQGSFGRVYRGVDQTLGTRFAVKVLSNAEQVAQFEKEIKVLSNLSHPNIIRLLGFSRGLRGHLLVYPLAAYGSLDAVLRDDDQAKRLSWPFRVSIALGVARALAHLHKDSQHVIFHRDVKAANIVLDTGKAPYLIDCGLSTIVDLDKDKGKSVITLTSVIGTGAYMDPTYLSSSKYSARSDVYSFGVVLLELLTGSVATDRDIKTPFAVKMIPPTLDPRLGPCPEGIARELIDLAGRCLSFDTDYRPDMVAVMRRLQVLDQQHRGALVPELLEEARALAKAAEEARAKADAVKLMCVSCREERVEGVSCSSGEHFLCTPCLAEYIRTQQEGEDVSDRMRGESLLCIDPKCKSEPLEDHLIVGVLAKHKHFTACFFQLKRKAIETAALSEVDRRVRAEKAELARLLRDDIAEYHRRYIQEEILTLRCPRCHQAFNDFSDCLALECSRVGCHAYFCGLCLADCGESQDAAHDHVHHCPLNPNPDKSLFVSSVTFSLVQRNRRRGLVSKYLGEAIPDRLLREEVVKRARKEFDDLGLKVCSEK
jgi:Ran GTPase-activating protein (RanGAP) involved in mRNA processing and transport